jgi:hypothetical protein
MSRVRAGESATLVTEQHGFQHVLGNGGAVHRHEGPRGTRRTAMDETCQDFLAGAGLACDEHGAIARGDPARQCGKPP